MEEVPLVGKAPPEGAPESRNGAGPGTVLSKEPSSPAVSNRPLTAAVLVFPVCGAKAS